MTDEQKHSMSMNLEKPYYSIYEAASVLDVHERTVRNHIRNGLLKAGKSGRQWRISKADLLDYIAPKN